MEKLLRAASADFLPALAVCAFCGLRTAEIMRLDWAEIRLGERYIELQSTKSKTGARRIVPIPDNLAQWLAPYAKKSGPVWRGPEDAFYDAQASVAEAAGVPWRMNACRHSFCSYRLAQCQDAAKTALEAGNSPAMVFKHYNKLVSPAQAAQWFAIAPTQAANVLPLKAHAI
jgi:integrase